jgi:radical SAM protein with 4Fe4S-binding SPASM domain
MSRPIYIDWVITNKCNLHCKHCVGMEEGELTHDEAMKVTGDIIKLSPQWVILEGGEPLMRPDMYEIGRMLRKAGIDTYPITNGNAFTDESLEELVTFSPKILFSIDGATAEIYEYTKTGAKFDLVKEWMNKCAERGIFHGITVVLSKLNIDQIEDLIRLTEGLGGKRIIFLPLKPFGEDKTSVEYYKKNALSPEEQEEAILKAYQCETSLDMFYDEPFLWNIAAKHGISLNTSDSGITIPEVQGCASAYSLYIQSNGDVRPCMFASERLTFGNAAKEPLEEVWNRMQNSDIITKWVSREQRTGACGECDHFDTCRGCLARTTRLTGDPLKSDPCCPISYALRKK